MRPKSNPILLALAATAFCACDTEESPSDSEAVRPAEPAVQPPPYRPVASTAVLMRGTISMAAEDYWSSVAIVVDLDGEHINQPSTDAEWERVWAAGITLAESGNLLMMPPRALDQGEWLRMSNAFIDVGLEAARAADDKDYQAVLDAGEKVYNLCTECHEQYMPSLSL
jgi:hypothetical protein